MHVTELSAKKKEQRSIYSPTTCKGVVASQARIAMCVIITSLCKMVLF